LVGLKVIVVDDDEDTVDMFAVALSACGASVTTATTAVAALELVREIRPNVILSDIAMPDEDGYWLVGAIRELRDDEMRRTPVVAATAYSYEHSRARALAAGFNDHLQKPVDPETLCRTIAKAAGR
jgi:CheY-like chemotaxis protein